MPNKYEPFKSATVFTKQIFKSFCDEIESLNIHYWELRKYASFLTEFFILDECGWVNLESLKMLYANATHLTDSNIGIRALVFENIIQFYMQNDDTDLMRGFSLNLLSE